MKKNFYTNALSGIWLLNKPIGISSRQCVDNFRQTLRIESAGHTGTLDPLAEGLLVVVTGTASKIQGFFCDLDKEYTTVVVLGAISETDDSEGPITPQTISHLPSIEEVEQVLATFVGEMMQTPPAYSAIQIAGQRAYDLARAGKKPILQPRPIVIHSIQILSYQFPQIRLVVRCSSGTYIRSLARDIGQRLNTGGYVQSLQRNAIGHFALASAHSVETIENTHCIPIEQGLQNHPSITLPETLWFPIRNGQKLSKTTILEQAISTHQLSPTTLQPFFLWMRNRIIAVAKFEEDIMRIQRILVIEMEGLSNKRADRY